MITLLVGHRGVGKTSLLDRIENYFARVERPVSCIDLDKEIVREQGCSVAEIFDEQGEKAFRKIESCVLQGLVERFRSKESSDVFIALGAGFEGPWPKECRVLWVQRVTDNEGRIFLDRPRLNREKTALNEFFERKKVRDERFEKVSDLKLVLREGANDQDQGEFEFFTKNFVKRSGNLTWLRSFSGCVLELPFDRLELRDDLEIPEDLNLDSSRLLFSRRKQDSKLEKNNDQHLLDQAMELEQKIYENADVVSVHEFLEGETLEGMFSRIENFAGARVLKIAPEIDSLSELLQGYNWQQEDPEKRVFLPRSESGRWCWFRLFMKAKMPLNFWRLDQGSAADQPTLLEWLNEPEEKTGFAAILGSPVKHSRTPTEQEEFFKEWGLPVYRIDISENEWNEAIGVLKKLGLVAAAVTAPLKHSAFLTATVKSMEAEELQSVNTLFFSRSSGQIHGHNTDRVGFKKSISGLEVRGPVAIWGGGGTLSMLLKEFENAVTFSARTGRPRVMRNLSKFSPKTVIWACSRDVAYKWPLHDWDPELVLDLSYAENSMGLEFAELMGCRYVSGIQMFKEQAKEQRRFWHPFLESEKELL